MDFVLSQSAVQYPYKTGMRHEPYCLLSEFTFMNTPAISSTNSQIQALRLPRNARRVIHSFGYRLQPISHGFSRIRFKKWKISRAEG